MAKNTFNQNHLDSIIKLTNEFDGIQAKRSAFYSKAVVIGRPNKNGAIILSLIDDETEQRSIWLVHLEKDKDPKTVADGKCNITGEEFRFYYWAEMLKGIRKLCGEI